VRKVLKPGRRIRSEQPGPRGWQYLFSYLPFWFFMSHIPVWGCEPFLAEYHRSDIFGNARNGLAVHKFLSNTHTNNFSPLKPSGCQPRFGTSESLPDCGQQQRRIKRLCEARCESLLLCDDAQSRSVCPVMRMTGTFGYDFANRSLTSNPEMPGIERSSNTQTEGSRSCSCKKASPDSKLTVASPVKRSTRVIKLRMPGSSSTIAMRGLTVEGLSFIEAVECSEVTKSPGSGIADSSR